MIRPIILTGPMAAGKSTVAYHLAKLTGIPNVPMDRIRWYFYFKNGFCQQHDSDLATFADQVAYWKPFEAKAVQQAIAEFPQSIIDFGTGHSCYEDESLFAAVDAVLKPLPNIFLLMPSKDKEKSLRICSERLEAAIGKPPSQSKLEINRTFINHESNYRLAKHIIFTESLTPQETASQIYELLV